MSIFDDYLIIPGNYVIVPEIDPTTQNKMNELMTKVKFASNPAYKDLYISPETLENMKNWHIIEDQPHKCYCKIEILINCGCKCGGK